MSLLGKISLSVSGLSLIVITSASWVLGGWLPILNIFLGILILGIILALVFDYKLYLSFLLMRTTKNGMSMGVSILTTLVFCGSLAYLSVQFEKSIDITEEKINSLSPQTTKLLESLTDDMGLIVFYKGQSGLGAQKKVLIKRNLILYKRASSKIKDRYYDAYVENKLAQKYLNDISADKEEDIFLFVEYKGKKVLVEFPFDEEKLTTAMIKVTRREQKTIYFLTGHGERDLSPEGEKGAGIQELKKALERSSFNTKPWNFVIDGLVPQDASALAIVGPQRPYVQAEIKFLEDYLKTGGKLFLALDPDRKHNLVALLKKFGVSYKSDYIMDPIGQGMRLGLYTAIGIYFDNENPITQSFQRGSMALFHVASSLEMIEGAEAFSSKLVRTNVNTVSVSNRAENPDPDKASSYTLALLVEEKEENEQQEEKKEEDKNKELKNQKDKKSWKLAVFGDSDFLSNNFINTGGMNKDLALNTLSYLVDEGDLLSIRPKKLKATQLALRQYDQLAIVLFAVILPILCFIVSFILWMRRRGA